MFHVKHLRRKGEGKMAGPTLLSAMAFMDDKSVGPANIWKTPGFQPGEFHNSRKSHGLQSVGNHGEALFPFVLTDNPDV